MTHHLAHHSWLDMEEQAGLPNTKFLSSLAWSHSVPTLPGEQYPKINNIPMSSKIMVIQTIFSTSPGLSFSISSFWDCRLQGFYFTASINKNSTNSSQNLNHIATPLSRPDLSGWNPISLCLLKWQLSVHFWLILYTLVTQALCKDYVHIYSPGMQILEHKSQKTRQRGRK